MSRREVVRMSSDEVDKFLRSNWRMVLGTNDRFGWPHLVTMEYHYDGSNVRFQTYRKSQKAKNIMRDTKVTCLVETGFLYHEIRGVQVIGRAEIVDDPRAAMEILMSSQSVRDQLGEGTTLPESPPQIVAKRVGIIVHPERIVSWDHGKLGERY